RRTGARLRIAGADPLAVRLLLARHRVSEDGIDILGLLSQRRLTEELLSAKALVAPSVGMESFGMVLARALACALPVVASDIPGYRDVVGDGTGRLVPPGDAVALAGAVAELLEDEPRRQALCAAGRLRAQRDYSWDTIAARLLDVYGLVAGGRAAAPAPPLEAVPAGSSGSPCSRETVGSGWGSCSACSRPCSSPCGSWWTGTRSGTRSTACAGGGLRLRSRSTSPRSCRGRSRGISSSARRCPGRRVSGSSSRRSPSGCSRTPSCPAGSASSRASPC